MTSDHIFLQQLLRNISSLRDRHFLFRALYVFLLTIWLTCPLSAHAASAEAHAVTLERTVEELTRCGVSGSLTNRLLALALEGELALADAENIAQALLRSCNEHLPVQPFADKTAEGLSKGVPAARIQSALNTKLDDYLFMRGLLAPLAEQQQISLTADLLLLAGETPALGLSRTDAEVLVTANPDTSPDLLVTGLRVLALMQQAGYPLTMANEIVGMGLLHRSLTPEWEHLPSVALQAGRRGMSELELTTAARDALEQGKSLRALMERLGSTPRDTAGAASSARK